MAAVFFSALADEVGVIEGGGIDAYFIGSGAEHDSHVLEGADATTDGERHEAGIGDFFNGFDHGGSAMSTGGDVEEDHFIGALVIVSLSQLDRIADIAQFSCFGPAKLLSTGHMTIVHIQTRDHSFCQIIHPRAYWTGRDWKLNPQSCKIE